MNKEETLKLAFNFSTTPQQTDNGAVRIFIESWNKGRPTRESNP